MKTGLPSHIKLADEIGRGSFCTTRRGINLHDQHEYSIRIINIDQLELFTGSTEQDIQNEIEICKRLIHPNIVEIYTSYKDGDQIYVVSEMLSGRDLCYEIVHKVNTGFVYSEAVASHYMRQVLDGLAYIHNSNIVHRDIKPHNVLLASEDPAAPVKIGDFGIAIEMPACGYIKTGRIGTPHFMSPEVVLRKLYGFPIDIWGCGVILYILLGGTFPFQGAGDDIFDVIAEGNYEMSSKTWDCISTPAKDLVKQMLEYDPSQRITAAATLEHPWLRERDRYAERTHLQESVNELKKFNARRKLKGAVLATMASRTLKSSLNTKINDFRENDVNNNAEVHGAAAMTQLIDALDDIKGVVGAKNHDIRFLQCLFENKKLQSIMEIHSLSKNAVKKLDIRAVKSNAEETLYEVSVLLNSLKTLDQQCKRLKNLLEKPHVMAVIKSHDDIVKELHGKNNMFENYKPIVSNGVAENLTRVRLVQFTKNTNEPLGITLRMDENKHCVVARIIHGGMIHRQGTLHAGDEIRDINGINVGTRSIEKLQQILRDATGDITFKIVPSLHNEEMEHKELFVRCLFDYDPRSDDLIPCQQAGIPFKCGDIIEILSKADHYWWQARKEGTKDTAGLIPSPELQERRTGGSTFDKSKKGGSLNCILPRQKKIKNHSRKYTARLNTAFDRLDLVTYEEVTYHNTFQRKSLVLIGAHGVGRRHIKNSLITRFPEKYAYPIAHTSRKPKPSEKSGDTWYFESEESMLEDIASHQFLEYGQHDGSLYGTKLTTIRDVINASKLPILDIETPALKILRCKEFAPYIVFISSPSNFPYSGDTKMDSSLQRLVIESSDLRNRYHHFFDYTIVNHTIEDTVEDLVNHLEQVEHSPEWLPASWMY